jgi:hypothetical protein
MASKRSHSSGMMGIDDKEITRNDLSTWGARTQRQSKNLRRKTPSEHETQDLLMHL